MKRELPDSHNMEGRYANFFRVGQNAFEFIVDFGQFYPGTRKGSFHTRIIMGPHYAKALMEMLSESLTRYEKDFGRQKNAVSEGRPLEDPSA
jgi:hypothetical protein